MTKPKGRLEKTPIDSNQEGWKKAVLGEVTEIKIGGTPSRKIEEYWDRDLKSQNYWVAISDIKKKFISNTKERISDEGVKKSNVKLIPPNTVIMSFKLSIGRIAITKVPLYTNEAIAAFLPIHKNEIDHNYLYYALNKVNYSEVVDIAVKGQTLNKQKLNELQISLPPISEQKKISDILTSIDNAIDKTATIINQTEELKKGLMQKLFAKGIKHTKFKTTELGDIPESWEVVLLDEVALRRSGHTPNKKKAEYWGGDIPWISLKDTQSLDNRYVTKTTDYTTKEGIENSSAVLLPKGTIVVSRDATVGKIGIMAEEMATSQHFINYICGDRLLNTYLYYDLFFRKKLFERIATGSTIKTIGLAFFKELSIALPPIEEQRKIASVLLTLDDKIQKEKEYFDKLQEIKSGVMQNLLTGLVRVKVDKEEVITS